ncbi:MAG: hypothetical protein A2W80_09695 [Candidatus Riflebacteria bacterium GWC2_50_8]|nr:MAG: hypothetical protein A2W80_09695 [Candidatus Riflebacteria bacterium GWC2_50_8]
MKTVFERYGPEEDIPARECLNKRKLAKYFNREISACVVAVARLLENEEVPTQTPFYFGKGTVEFEDFGLSLVIEACTDESGRFSQQNFVERGMSSLSPLTQFKVLYNMPLSFISIDRGLTGDNSIIYGSAAGLLLQAKHCTYPGRILLGASKVHADAVVEAGFALCSRDEIDIEAFSQRNCEAIEIFRLWHCGNIL